MATPGKMKAYIERQKKAGKRFVTIPIDSAVITEIDRISEGKRAETVETALIDFIKIYRDKQGELPLDTKKICQSCDGYGCETCNMEGWI